jgi:hypothetical protein
MRSTPLVADGKLYLCTNGGRWWTLRPNARGTSVVQRSRLDGEASDGSPIVSRGRIFVPTSEFIYCIGTPDHEPQLDDEIVAMAEARREAIAASTAGSDSADSDTEPAHLQVVPWDTLLKPGDKQEYRVRVYNKHGDYLRDAAPGDVAFSVAGPGTIGSSGTFSAPADAEHECALVTCKVGDLTGTARVRVVPPLPWAFDFEGEDDVPLTWVGGRVRHVLTDLGSNRVIVRPTELPTRPGQPTTKLGTRSQMWMGPVEMANYTVTADVMLPIGEGNSESTADDEPQPEFPSDLPPGASKQADIGLINSRYTLTLFGASQEARLYSWCTHDKRSQAALPFEIEPQTWYTMKLRVEQRDDQALVRGKVWERGEAEPDEWTLEVTDPAPNRVGSPGLFGSAKDAEVFVDNITVVAND